MHGFKSFARKTEIVFDKGINVILGPNGSGKSNVSDALCFVLGRLSIKSMRAAKAKNLMFMGSKYIKPAREANVELVFDNSDRVFGIDKDEIVLSRTVKHNGQGVYKINGETKTRIEIIEMLAHAGIDPHGFNLVLQGQIQAIVKMHPEDRRKIIEEVAGISIYELRKEKSLHELVKTDEKLKEISAILREKSAYLKNLEKERSQAMHFKELETTVRRAKASLLQKKINEKKKELSDLEETISEKTKQKDEIRTKSVALNAEIEALNAKVSEINKSLQRATGLEQETLHTNIANLKAELEGLRVRKEGYDNRRAEFERRIDEMKKSIPQIEEEIKQLAERSPIVAQKNNELKKKREELAKLEEEKKRFHTLRAEIAGLKERIRDKERALSRAQAESESVLKQMEEYTRMCAYQSEKDCNDALTKMRATLEESRKTVKELNAKILEYEKKVSVAQAAVEIADKTKADVASLDICPLCQSKITTEHIDHVVKDCDSKTSSAKETIESSEKERKAAQAEINRLQSIINETENKVRAAEMESMRHKTIKDKQEQLKRSVSEEQIAKKELVSFDEKRVSLESKISSGAGIDEQYDSKMAEIEEISARTEENIDNTIMFRQRDLENMKNIIKRSLKDKEEIDIDIKNMSENLETKKAMLTEKEKQEKDLTERFKKMFEERDNTQSEAQEKNIEVSEMQSAIRQMEEQINYLKIGVAKIDAEKQTFEMEASEYIDVEIIVGSANFLTEKLTKAQEQLKEIGAINMRALEVYDEIKKEYDFVAEKTATLENERVQIMSIIEEIDKKKVRSFMKTFHAMNDLFTENFSRVYTKGKAFLEIENPEDVFAGGVTIAVKLAKGKYFDVTSLSGGEQTLVALSLLFAIQEYRPYHFYVFDEIDAALDKRNSERLAGLLAQYMKSGQYIVITHNDAIIMNANVLYGVSMHDGVSKILSLNLKGSASELPAVVQTGFEQDISQGNKEAVIETLSEGPAVEETDEPASEVIAEENGELDDEESDELAGEDEEGEKKEDQPVESVAVQEEKLAQGEEEKEEEAQGEEENDETVADVN